MPHAAARVARLRGRRRVARRRDRGRAADRARSSAPRRSCGRTRSRRARGAVDRLLVRRPAGRPPPALRGLCRCSCSRRGAAGGRAVRRPSRSSRLGRRARRASRPARSPARCSACSRSSPCRCCCSARSSPYAIRLSSQRVEDAGGSPGRLTRSRPSARWSACSSRAAADPARGHAAHVPGLRARARAGGRARRCGRRLRARAGRRRRCCSRCRSGRSRRRGDGDRVIYEAETEYQYARVVEEPDGERRLELNEGQARPLGLPARTRC